MLNQNATKNNQDALNKLCDMDWKGANFFSRIGNLYTNLKDEEARNVYRIYLQELQKSPFAYNKFLRLSRAFASTMLAPLFDVYIQNDYYHNYMDKLSCRINYVNKGSDVLNVMIFVGKFGEEGYNEENWQNQIKKWIESKVYIIYIYVNGKNKASKSNSSDFLCEIFIDRLHELLCSRNKYSQQILNFVEKFRDKYYHFHPSVFITKSKKTNDEFLSLWVEKYHVAGRVAKYVRFYPPAVVKSSAKLQSFIQEFKHDVCSIVKVYKLLDIDGCKLPSQVENLICS